MNAFKKELRGKVKELGDLIKIGDTKHVKQWFYRDDDEGIFDILVHDIKTASGETIAIDTGLSAEGWKIEVINRNGDKTKVKTVLRKLDIPIEQEKEDRVQCKHFGYDEPLGEVQESLQMILDKLAKALLA